MYMIFIHSRHVLLAKKAHLWCVWSGRLQICFNVPGSWRKAPVMEVGSEMPRRTFLKSSKASVPKVILYSFPLKMDTWICPGCHKNCFICGLRQVQAHLHRPKPRRHEPIFGRMIHLQPLSGHLAMCIATISWTANHSMWKQWAFEWYFWQPNFKRDILLFNQYSTWIILRCPDCQPQVWGPVTWLYVWFLQFPIDCRE